MTSMDLVRIFMTLSYEVVSNYQPHLLVKFATGYFHYLSFYYPFQNPLSLVFATWTQERICLTGTKINHYINISNSIEANLYTYH